MLSRDSLCAMGSDRIAGNDNRIDTGYNSNVSKRSNCESCVGAIAPHRRTG